MAGQRLGRLHRVLRRRERLPQEDLARRSGVGRWKIVKLEAGQAADLRLGEVARCFEALDARLDVRGWYHGTAADRLLDERHALLVGAFVQVLRRYGCIAGAADLAAPALRQDRRRLVPDKCRLGQR